MEKEVTVSIPETERVAGLSRQFIKEEKSDEPNPKDEGFEEESGEETEQEKRLYGGKFNTAEELESDYQKTQAALTQANQEKAGIRRLNEDLTRVISTVRIPVKTKLSENFRDRFDDNPQEATDELVEVATNAAYTRLEQERIKREDQEAINYIQSAYPDIVIPENYAVLDGLAIESTSPTARGKYEEAIRKYKDRRKAIIEDAKPSILKEAQKVDEMKSGARIEGSVRSVGGGKTFSSAQLGDMMVNHPEEYARRQDEIMKAYKENRVR